MPEERRIDREFIVEALTLMRLEWGDEAEAIDLVDLLLQQFNPFSAWAWLLFHCNDLGGTPLAMIQEGRSREVVVYARTMVDYMREATS